MASHDYVIIGAGSAGCVLASRLSQDPDHRVLLLEAGGSHRHPNVKIPAAWSKLFKTERDWDHATDPEPHLDGRSLYIPRGRMLGGSSSMNAMIYIRGRRHDYDTWRKMGCDGWGYDDVLPYYRRSEDNATIHDEFHGVGGELRVEDLRHPNPLSRAFVDSAIAAGFTLNRDFNGATQEGFGHYQVTQRRGFRWSAADAFLRPARRRPNLTVVTGAHVRRIILDGSKAVGVEYLAGGEVHLAGADREILLSAGAINSPQILMLSGIGPAGHLRDLGIAPVVDLPVGSHLQDHPVILQIWESTAEVSLADAEHPLQLLRLLATRRGLLTSNVGEAGGFVHSRADLAAADLQFHMGPAYFASHGFETYAGHAFSIGPTLISVTSEGNVRLRSKDPTAKPAITGNFLSDPAEMRALVKGIRIGREIAATGPLARMRGREIYPGPDRTSDADLTDFVRARAEVLYHPVGTCRMGLPDDAVVDPTLRVYGIDGLRVVDASVMPMIVGGNTNAPTIMIAEKASDLILGA